ncbi:RAD52 motif-containing protein 1 [Apodemus speciosus]|uniref:RAD52 motif-containing protein 1 n=1 Tax=Apodemus speciosus TaxID=105296 RepID=A0ABQ0FCA3_APOSI
MFSQFGLLYSVRVFPNAAVARPGFYAIIKFYSSRDAQRAQKACDGEPLFQTSPVKGRVSLCRPGCPGTSLCRPGWPRTQKSTCLCLPSAGITGLHHHARPTLNVRLGTRHKALQHQAFALNSSRCQELANYYFGFNGWSKRIVKLQELSGLEDAALVVPMQKQNPQFFCAVEVVLPSYGCRSPGVGISEEPLHQVEEGPASLLTKRKTAQKLAFQAALADAFQRLTIVVLGFRNSNRLLGATVGHGEFENVNNSEPSVFLSESGRIAVEYRPTEEDLDARTEEELQNLIQVSCFPGSQPSQREEECLSDFSLEEEDLKLCELH